MEGNTFCGLSQAAWSDLFLLSKFFVPSLVLVCFGAYYQLRKKTEVAIQVGVTRLRIAAYNDIAQVYSRLSEQESPTLAEASKINEILGYYGYEVWNTDFSSCIGSEQGFDAFYDSICESIRSNEIYLDYKVKKQCTNAIGIFTELKLFLDAYCDTELHLNDGRLNTESLQERKNLGYRLTAVVMKNEINKAFLQVCDVIAGEINGMRISYRKHRIRKLAYYLFESIIRWADKYMSDESWRGWLSSKILPKVLGERLTLVSTIPMLVDIFAYLHVSDKYSPSAYFSMDEDERMRVSSDFLKLYYFQLHHNR